VAPKAVAPPVKPPVTQVTLPESTEDEIEMEETVHDYDKMTAMSVIEAEMALMQTYIKKA
jgi:hypothetical protein